MNKIKILIMKILFFVARKIKYGHITIKFSNGKKWEIDFSKGDQAFLSFDGGLKVFEIKYNSSWYGKMELSKFLELCAMVTHSRLIQRDMFQKRKHCWCLVFGV